MKDYAVTNDMIRELIEQLPIDDFDSHDVIQHIMRRYPQQYTMDLYSFVAKDDPIHRLHASIGQRLLAIELIEKADADKTPSPNVRGNDNNNQKWRRKKS
jgi:hypothetical protein